MLDKCTTSNTSVVVYKDTALFSKYLWLFTSWEDNWIEPPGLLVISESRVTDSDQYEVNWGSMYPFWTKLLNCLCVSFQSFLTPAFGTSNVSDIAALLAWVPRRHLSKSPQPMHHELVAWVRNKVSFCNSQRTVEQLQKHILAYSSWFYTYLSNFYCTNS